MTHRSAERWNTGKRGAVLRRAELDGADWAKAFPSDPTPKDLARELAARYPILSHRYWRFLRGALKWVESRPVEF